MKKALIIVMLGIHLAGNTEVGQLLRLPELIAHYFQHHRQNNEISFFEFLSMHYGGDDGTNADNDYDNQLPCHNFQHNTISLAFSPMIQETDLSMQLFYPDAKFSFELPEGKADKHVQLILQPPRA